MSAHVEGFVIEVQRVGVGMTGAKGPGWLIGPMTGPPGPFMLDVVWTGQQTNSPLARHWRQLSGSGEIIGSAEITNGSPQLAPPVTFILIHEVSTGTTAGAHATPEITQGSPGCPVPVTVRSSVGVSTT